MNGHSAPSISLHAAPDAAVVTAIVVATIVVAVGVVSIAPHNQMKGIARTSPLPIATLPKGPVMQLAFARNQHDIATILHVGEQTQQDAIKAVATGNFRDTVVLVPGYTLLLIALTLLIARASGPAGMSVFGAGLVLTMALALADFAENYGIATALSAAQHGHPMSDAARRVMVAAAFSKWTLLTLIGIGLGVASALHHRKWGRRLVAPLLLAASIVMLATVARHGVTLLPVVPVAPAAAPSHSGRSASMTSTRDARAAGTSDASTAATTRIIAAATIGMKPGIRTSSIYDPTIRVST
jgi:hypothetical protein